MYKQKTIDEIVYEIKDVIESIRFYVSQDGGDLEFTNYDEKNKIVFVTVFGKCVGCPLLDLSYKDGIETILKNEVEGVNSVVILEKGE